MSHGQWIFADASAAGTVRFASAVPGSPGPGVACTMPSSEHSTFTDALLAYEREAGIVLRGAECVLAVAGIAVGEAIPVMRSRWTISRSGLGAVLDRPATIVNDVAATAWSLLGGASVELLDGSIRPDFSRAGRWALVLLDEGVGTAALDIDAHGRATVIDAEAGHTGFSPQGDDEIERLRQLRTQLAHVSWEAALTRGWPYRDERWAAMAGAFAGDVLLATGAWSGVIVTGKSAADLRQPRHQAAFSARLLAKNCYHRQLGGAARCLLTARDPLAGAHALLATRHRGKV